MSSPGRRRDAGSGGAKKHLRPFKRGLEGRPDYVRNLQSQGTIAPHDNRINNRDWVRSLVPWAALSAFQLLENHCNSYLCLPSFGNSSDFCHAQDGARSKPSQGRSDNRHSTESFTGSPSAGIIWGLPELPVSQVKFSNAKSAEVYRAQDL